jgi:hypothetical protein
MVTRHEPDVCLQRREGETDREYIERWCQRLHDWTPYRPPQSDGNDCDNETRCWWWQ